MMLVQQSISVYWTKLSRGGQEAVVRNAVPEVLPVSVLRAHFDEDTDFQFSTSGRDSIGEMLVSYIESDGKLTVSYAGIRGVSDRQIQTRTIFQLAPREWGQVIANCRGITGEDIWTYGKHVVNIYWGDPPAEDLFTTTSPTHQFRDEKKLY